MATHAHAVSHAGEHDHDPLHGYVPGDDLPSHGPVPAEPHSPAWLPIVGILLFACMLVYGLASPTDEESQGTQRAVAAALSAASPSPSASAAPAPPPDADQAAPAPPKPVGTVRPKLPMHGAH